MGGMPDYTEKNWNPDQGPSPAETLHEEMGQLEEKLVSSDTPKVSEEDPLSLLPALVGPLTELGMTTQGAGRVAVKFDIRPNVMMDLDNSIEWEVHVYTEVFSLSNGSETGLATNGFSSKGSSLSLAIKGLYEEVGGAFKGKVREYRSVADKLEGAWDSIESQSSLTSLWKAPEIEAPESAEGLLEDEGDPPTPLRDGP